MTDISPNTGTATLTPPRRIPFPVILGVWSLFWLLNAQRTLLVTISSGGEVESWTRPFLTALTGILIWSLLTRPLMWNTRRIRDRVSSRTARFALHVGTFVIVHLADLLIYEIESSLTGAPPHKFVPLIFQLATFNGLTYAVVAVVTLSIDYHDAFRERALRAAQVEAQLALAQFQALRAQLHPHFLFNSLNAISALMHSDVGRADRMLARLSELLRMAVDTAATPEIRLIDEMEFVKRYLETEQMRFGDRLDVRVALPSETYDALVPTMLLQPLVENAVRHGVAPHAGPARVEVQVEKSGASLGIVVRDTGKGLDLSERNGGNYEGVGLRTTRERLERLYGSAQELVLANVPGGGFETRVTLPFRVSGDGA